MVKRNLNRILVVAVTMLAFVVSATFVTQAFAQACPKTCPMKAGKGSEASCIMAKSGNSGKFLKPYFEMRNLLMRDKTEGTGSLAKKLAANAKICARSEEGKGNERPADALRKIESAATVSRPPT
jgi:hypothetical protein